ncbi:hypothetical protein CC86DRAFT_462404 [Ophiobolus disseminans]|uniref:Biotrophy-associated secreted protein 2 n=1 Tax=Ophiobolus disseminans TaxID=1469910 RepID=A0A6A7AHE9_9PLEO|nr:hypothetical protein CC86DRAFT_462404 [Ophiobolus disseminans]
MAPIFKFIALMSFSLCVAAQNLQFITGVCASDAACASGCCGFTSGKCAAPFVAKERGESCGFGNAQPNDNALNGVAGNANQAAAPVTPAPAPNVGAGNANQGAAPAKAAGTQFITGPCTSDADCAAGCCGFNTGKCAGPVVAQDRDGGCGFGDAQPNDDAAQALQGRKLGRRGPMLM